MSSREYFPLSTPDKIHPPTPSATPVAAHSNTLTEQVQA